MKCKKCGQKLAKGQATCPACGAPAPKPRRGLWGTVFVIVLVALLSAALIGYNLYSRSELTEFSLDGLRGLFRHETTVSAEPSQEDVEPPVEDEAPAEETRLVEEEPAAEPLAKAPAEAEEEAEALPALAAEAVSTPEAAAVSEESPESAAESIEEAELAAASEEAPGAESVPALADMTVLDAAPSEEAVEAVAEDEPLSALALYRAVESQNFAALSAKLAAWSERCAQSAAAPLDQRVELLLRLSLSEAGRQIAAKLVNMDMSWLESVSVAGEVNLLDARAGEALRFSLNDCAVLGVELLAAYDAGSLTLRVPELSESWVALDMADGEAIGSGASMEQTRAVLAALPSGHQLDTMLKGYFDLLLQCVETVEQASGTLEAEGVVQSCTTLTLDIDGETAARLASALVGELRWDEELEQLIRSLAAAAGQDGDTVYASFLDALDQLDYELSQGEESGDTLRMVVYVDENKVIRGRSFRMLSDSNSFQFSYACPRDGERFGLELRAIADGELLELAGRGTCADELLQGSFILRQGRGRLARLDADSRRSEDGRVLLDLTLTPGQRLYTALARDLPEQLQPYCSDLSLHISLNASDEDLSAQAELSRAAESLCALDVSELFSQGAAVEEAPAALTQEEWLGSLDAESADPVFENLKATGLPAALQLALRAYWKSLFAQG